MDTTSATGSRFALHPFRALRLADSYVGDPVANRVFARPYRAVPARLRDWRRKRHLRVDARPALYLHEYTSAGVSIRGVVALLDLTSARDRVFPHEDVHADQVTQLADRMAEMSLNPAPILLMHRGPESVRETLRATAATNFIRSSRSMVPKLIRPPSRVSITIFALVLLPFRPDSSSIRTSATVPISNRRLRPIGPTPVKTLP